MRGGESEPNNSVMGGIFISAGIRKGSPTLGRFVRKKGSVSREL